MKRGGGVCPSQSSIVLVSSTVQIVVGVFYMGVATTHNGMTYIFEIKNIYIKVPLLTLLIPKPLYTFSF